MRSNLRRLMSATALSCVAAASFSGFEASAEPATRASVKGTYAGAFFGQLRQDSLEPSSGDVDAWEEWDSFDPDFGSKSQEYGLESSLLGLTVGYNWLDASERFVLGAEADYTIHSNEGIDGLLTLRARAGLLVGKAAPTMIYATAGFAAGKVDPLGFATIEYFDSNPDVGSPENATGTVFGFGAEHWVSDKLSLKAEYRVIKLSDVQTMDYLTTSGESSNSFDWKAEQIILGVNHKF